MKNKRSFSIALFVIFIDYLGIGLIYPLFSSMLFDTSHPLLPFDTNIQTRGFYLGILLALMPFFQFFTSPLWGALSDKYGRKPPLLTSLALGVLGYTTLYAGAAFHHITLLFIGRALTGLSSGNTSIIQACIADISSKDSKSRYFSLYSMALGSGFTLGPFLGGLLSTISYPLPFLFTLFLLSLNLIFAYLFFKETLKKMTSTPLSIHKAFHQLLKAFKLKGLRIILLASFLHCFGWSYFFEFIPVYFIKYFSFSTLKLGIFYAAAGAFYALSTGLLIQPILQKFKNETLFFAGNLLAGCAILSILILPSIHWLWIVLFFICYFVAFVTPTSTTLISNNTTKTIQGESLGVLTSVNAAAFTLSPLFSSSMIGSHPSLSIKVGGGFMLAAGLLCLFYFKQPLLKRFLNIKLQ